MQRRRLWPSCERKIRCKPVATIRDSIDSISEYLFAYGTLQPGLAPQEVALLVEKLRFVGDGFASGKLYDLGRYPGAVFDRASSRRIYGVVFALPDDAETLLKLDAYEDDEYMRIEREITLIAGGAQTCWVYDYRANQSNIA